MRASKSEEPVTLVDESQHEEDQFETSVQADPPTTNSRPLTASSGTHSLKEISQRVLWTATAMIDAANRGRPNPDGVKVGGHQASSASMVGIMTALWFSELTALDRVSVKPHASPVLHAINYLLGTLDESYLSTLRERDGLQPYPSRTKDPDKPDFSTGSVGIGATAPIWAALSHRYLSDQFPDTPPAGRFISLLGDAEMDEGAVWEAIIDTEVRQLGEVLWIVDLNRQSLDRVIPDVQIERLRGMFAAADWQVLSCTWGRQLQEVFGAPGGEIFERRMRTMPNEEYQRILRAHPAEIRPRLVSGMDPAEAETVLKLIENHDDHELAELVRDLGGHDLEELVSTFQQVEDTRPTIIFAYTIKGRGLAIEGHPNNHSAQLTLDQMEELAVASGMTLADPWVRFPEDSEAGKICAEVAARLQRDPIAPVATAPVPTQFEWKHKAVTSTQATLGQVLSDLRRAAPEVAARVVTTSPDVASSTNLGGWINKAGVWSLADRQDWFADDRDRLLRWQENTRGQHIELGIAEVNLVSLAGELGLTNARWGQPLIPIATIYDPFINRALEPWTFGLYAGGRSIMVGTPSGVTLAPEGGAHQSINTPSITLEIPELTSWEPAFAQDLEWTLLEAMRSLHARDGSSAYFRLSTRPVDQSLAQIPEDELLRERRRQEVLAGGYRISQHAPEDDEVVLVGVGAMMTEVIAAAQRLETLGVRAGVVCLTSPSLIFRALHSRDKLQRSERSAILDRLFPLEHAAPIVTVTDAHPHTLAFLAAVRGSRIRMLGVTEFGQGASLSEAYRLHGIDTESITNAVLDLVR